MHVHNGLVGSRHARYNRRAVADRHPHAEQIVVILDIPERGVFQKLVGEHARNHRLVFRKPVLAPRAQRAAANRRADHHGVSRVIAVHAHYGKRFEPARLQPDRYRAARHARSVNRHVVDAAIRPTHGGVEPVGLLAVLDAQVERVVAVRIA